MKDVPAYGGTRLLRDRDWRPAEDSYLATRFCAAGFIVVGKANTPELGLSPTTEPDSFGPTRNPGNPARIVGSSSGGSPAAVAAGLTPIAHAGDGGGSIRNPAGTCGLVGLKPSRGRTSMGPEKGEGWTGCVTGHVFEPATRSVHPRLASGRGLVVARTIASVLSAPIVGRTPIDPPPGVIGSTTDSRTYRNVTPDVESA